MSIFTYDTAMDGDRKVLQIDSNPVKVCCFNCVFCPVGKTSIRTTEVQHICDAPLEEMKQEIDAMIEREQPDFVYLHAGGEAVLADHTVPLIHHIKSKQIPIQLLSTGAMLGDPRYMEIANLCEEVSAEFRCSDDRMLQKLQRPAPGITLETYIENLAKFQAQYPGKLILEVASIRRYNDNDEALQKICEHLRKIKPDEAIAVRYDHYPKFIKAFGVDDETLAHMKDVIDNWDKDPNA